MFFAKPGEYEPCGIFTPNHFKLIIITSLFIAIALKFTIHKNKATVQKKNCVIHIECSQLIFHDTTRGDRIFNTCGGINTAHLYTKMKKNSEVSFQITVAATS